MYYVFLCINDMHVCYHIIGNVQPKLHAALLMQRSETLDTNTKRQRLHTTTYKRIFGAFLIVFLFMGYLNHRLRYTGLNFGKAFVMNSSFTDLIWFI